MLYNLTYNFPAQTLSTVSFLYEGGATSSHLNSLGSIHATRLPLGAVNLLGMHIIPPLTINAGTHFTYPQGDGGLSQPPATLSWEWVLNPDLSHDSLLFYQLSYLGWSKTIPNIVCFLSLENNSTCCKNSTNILQAKTFRLNHCRTLWASLNPPLVIPNIAWHWTSAHVVTQSHKTFADFWLENNLAKRFFSLLRAMKHFPFLPAWSKQRKMSNPVKKDPQILIPRTNLRWSSILFDTNADCTLLDASCICLYSWSLFN